MPLFDRPVLMWVTDRRNSDAPLPELARIASVAGVDIIQVRERGLDGMPMELLIRAMQKVVLPQTRIVINSEIGLAAKLGLGVHLPEAGPSIIEAREVLGGDALVGRSVHSPEAAAESTGANYLVAGHVFETGSKPGRPPMGLDRFAAIAGEVSVPVLAIGGITPERVPDALRSGAAGVAVLSPLTRLDTISATAAAYRNALEQSMSQQTADTITATINGKLADLPAGTSVSEFLAGRELHERLVVVERNGEIIKRSTFADVIIEEGDLLEIVHFVGGG